MANGFILLLLLPSQPAQHEEEESLTEGRVLEPHEHRFQQDLKYIKSELLRPCRRGDDQACDELTALALNDYQVATHPDDKWGFTKVLMDACKARYGRSCQALVEVGKAYMADNNARSIRRGKKALVRACRVDPEHACPVAKEIGTRLFERQKGTKERRAGRDLLGVVCRNYDESSCLDGPAPSAGGADLGRGQRIAGTVLGYSGMAVGLVGALVFADRYGENRCEQGKKGSKADSGIGVCAAAWLAYFVGNAATTVGTKLYLGGRAQAERGDPAAGGSNWWLWGGLAAYGVGTLYPLLIQMSKDATKENIGAGAAIFALGGQILMLVGRFLGPDAGDDMKAAIAPAILPVQGRHGKVEPGLGLGFLF